MIIKDKVLRFGSLCWMVIISFDVGFWKIFFLVVGFDLLVGFLNIFFGSCRSCVKLVMWLGFLGSLVLFIIFFVIVVDNVFVYKGKNLFIILIF